jgi:hypothetical protein
MTRKRTRESLLHTLTEPCSACEGKGYTKSRRTISYELFRELRRQGDLIQGDTVLVEVHPEVAQVLATSDHAFLEDMEKRLQKRIVVKARGSFHLEDFEIRSPGDKQPLERSEAGGGGREADKGERDAKRRKRRRRGLGSPAEIEALLAEDEAASVVDPEALAGEGAAEAASADEAMPNGVGADSHARDPGSAPRVESSSPAPAGDEPLDTKPPVE